MLTTLPLAVTAFASSCLSTCPSAHTNLGQCLDGCASATNSLGCEVACLYAVRSPDPTSKALWNCYQYECTTPAPRRLFDKSALSESALTHTISDEFWLLPEVSNVPFEGTERVMAQLKRWRAGASFGVMENKLLSHSLLEALNVPQPAVLYGAFATKSLGAWPRFNRSAFLAAMHGKTKFVLKSATNGGNVDVLVMDERRWASEGWNRFKLAEYAQNFVKNRWHSEWGQRYEHRAVIVQESLVPDVRGGFDCEPGELRLEVKVHAPLGRLASARLQALPFKGDTYLDVQFRGGEVACLGGRNLGDTAQHCARAVTLLETHRKRLEEVARSTTRVLGADWLRLDVFLSEAGTFSVNELSYPSHIGGFIGGGDEASLGALRDAYASNQLTKAPAAAFVAQLLAATGVDPYAFLLEADFATMRHADEATYASRLWQWDPAEEDARAAAAAPHIRLSIACAAIVAVGLCLLCLVALWLQSAAPDGGRDSGRSAHLDNAKFLCSSLIIFGHYLYYNLDHSTHLVLHDYQSWLQGAAPTLLFLLQVTNWRINLACFVSGNLMAKPVDASRFASFVRSLVLPTLIWVFAAKPLLNRVILGGEAPCTVLADVMTFKAHHHEWYLEALILWRLLSFAIWPLRGPFVVLLAIGASHIAGYWDVGEGGFFSFDHALGFLPYFLAGWACPLDRLATAVPRTPTTFTIGLGLMVALPMAMTLLEPLPDNHGTYGWFYAQSEFEATAKLAAEGVPLPYRLYWTRRAAKHVIEIAQLCVVLLTLVPRSTRWFTGFGKHTLYAFLLHEFVLAGRERLLTVAPPLPVLTRLLSHLLVLASQYALCLALCALLCSSPVRRLFGLVLEPTWLSSLLCTAPPARTQPEFVKRPSLHRLLPTANRSLTPDVGHLSLAPNSFATKGAETSDVEAPPLKHEGTGSLDGWLEWITEVEYAKGRLSLPWQASGHALMRYLALVPCFSLLCMGTAAFFFLPVATQVLADGGAEHIDAALTAPCVVTSIAVSVLAKMCYEVGLDVLTFKCLFRGLRRPALPEDRERLVHAVIICAYKEPFEVLAATIGSLAANNLAKSCVVILATEARDESADSTFAQLHAEFGGAFLELFQTRHSLGPGEVAGKSSNERHACMELYSWAQARSIDPYTVMVTTADADSQFDSVFLEHLEAEFCRQPDGRHTLFDSPINTYRNLAACHPLVAVFEIERTQYCTFSALQFQPAQSNYSLTLGMAHLIDYWHPDNTSEDLHTTLKAVAFTNAAANVVVPVWSIILNDSVTGLRDRWVQAKRHMWGIEETAWVASLFPLLRWKIWLRMLQLTAGQMLTTTVVPPWLILLFPQMWAMLAALPPRALALTVGLPLLTLGFQWVRTLVREAVLHQCILKPRREASKMLPISPLQWLHWGLAYPVYAFGAGLVFNTMATWAMLLHAINHTTYGYVCAPKALMVQGADAV